jgi:Pyruvate/2-oxoacid:ferredoxin oxidoreductase delta subunit
MPTRKWIKLGYLYFMVRRIGGMSHFQRLSRRQKTLLGWSLLLAVLIVAVGWLLEPDAEQRERPTVTTQMTIRQIAPKISATGFAMAKEMGLKRNVDKDTPLEELGIEQEQLDEVAAHLLSHRGRNFKYYLFAAICLMGLVWMTQLGRPDESPNSERRSWYPQWPYITALVISVVFCGFVLGKSPNPMEGAVKIFKGLVGLQPSMVAVVFAFCFFVGLAIIGNKIICGWACPYGALQELLYTLPFFKKLKRKKVPFLLSNLIRGGLFILMLLLLFGVVGGKRGFVVYHFMNPFNLFNLTFETPTILMTVVITLGLALVVYRPFCQFICPFGFVSWLAERKSWCRVRVNRDRCNGCGACARACPLPTAKHLVEGRFFAADCYSCARCLRVCPEEALEYGVRLAPMDMPSTGPVVVVEDLENQASSTE